MNDEFKEFIDKSVHINYVDGHVSEPQEAVTLKGVNSYGLFIASRQTGLQLGNRRGPLRFVPWTAIRDVILS